jgi:Cytochrome P460
MLNIKISFFVMLLLCTTPVLAADNKGEQADDPLRIKRDDHFPEVIFAQSDADNARMDLPPSMYADFWKKWHFVTTRWRQDIHEFRLSYANDLAWKTLSEGRTDYPVGAMFGKLVYPAEEDLALPSSVMPSKLMTRLMVMLWDPKHKKASSDGWVYLRFINPEPRAPQDKNSTGIWGVMSQKEVNACVECHSRVADRGYVFSQPMSLLNDKKSYENQKASPPGSPFSDLMTEMPFKTLPRIAHDLMRIIPDWIDRTVMGYQGEFFAGALGEIGPALTKMAQKDPNKIYMVYDRDDVNTIQLVSRINKKGYENCVGLVRLRGSSIGMPDDEFAKEKRKSKPKEQAVSKTEIQEGDAGYPKAIDVQQANAKAVITVDTAEKYKPAATLYTVCGGEGISRQTLPLLYTAKDKDGLPSYYFAPLPQE